MEISYQLSEDDYRQGYKAFLRRTTYSLWRSRIAYAVLFFTLAVALFVSIFGPDRNFPTLALLWGLAAFWTCSLWYSPRYLARKMITGNPSASLPHAVEMSEDGLNFRTSASESRLTWELITGWAEVDRVFALFPSPISFLPIPKRALTHDQQDELRSLLQQKISSRK
ncbi:MAG TPA: YcxB family protein [Pyrinomonadaceae bacterium]|jgi:YcxB-like protein|nr:YcxB family protein [Pyrinomonadaceae bacterium]